MTTINYSFTIGPDALPAVVKPWPQPRIAPAIQWKPSASGGLCAVDRGQVQDVHESDVTFFGTRDTLETLRTYLNTNARAGVTLHSLQTKLFCPLIDHTNDMPVNIVPAMAAQRYFISNGGLGYYEMGATIRAQTYSYVTATASLTALNLQNGFVSDKSYAIKPRYSYTRSPSYSDPDNEVGVFGPVQFEQDLASTCAILKYILTAGTRAIPFTIGQFPFADVSFPGVDYPFGPTMGNTPSCIITDIGISRRDLHRWIITLTFQQVFV